MGKFIERENIHSNRPAGDSSDQPGQRIYLSLVAGVGPVATSAIFLNAALPPQLHMDKESPPVALAGRAMLNVGFAA